MNNLEPQYFTLSNGQPVALFPDPAMEIVRIDFTFDAGMVRQPKPLVAAAANSLFSEGTLRHSAEEIAEFLDFRGIILEKTPDPFGPSVTLYMLRKYAAEALPLLYEMLTEPLFSSREFEVYCAKKRAQLCANMQKTKYVARNLFYSGLYGKGHPLGTHAVEEDFDRLTLQDVQEFYHRYYALSQAIVHISGGYDEALLRQFDLIFGQHRDVAPEAWQFDERIHLSQTQHLAPIRQSLSGTVQSSLRIGRLLPMEWHSMDYARFLVLNTCLGGYFGSRLMTNLREDKGYTYGIYSQSLIHRGSIAFFITAEVGAQVADAAVEEVYRELQRLQDEPVSEEELELVKHYMEGDFMRSVDGIFERSERHRQMQPTAVTEQFTANYFEALRSTTPDHLQALARELFPREQLLQVVVG